MDVDKKKPVFNKASTPSASNAPKTNKVPTGKSVGGKPNRRTLWKNAFDSPFTVRWYVFFFSSYHLISHYHLTNRLKTLFKGTLSIMRFINKLLERLVRY